MPGLRRCAVVIVDWPQTPMQLRREHAAELTNEQLPIVIRSMRLSARRCEDMAASTSGRARTDWTNEGMLRDRIVLVYVDEARRRGLL